MSEDILREVIGLAKKSKWNQIKKFIKFIVQKTLKKEAGYRLTALEASINGRKKKELNILIQNEENIIEIDKINSFNHLTLYQSTPFSNNLIDISQSNGTIIVLAKYLGPALTNIEIFDFSVHLDALNEPFFTIGNGMKTNGSEIIEIINANSTPKVNAKKEKEEKRPVQVEEVKEKEIEVLIFEKLTKKNAIWKSSETKTFQNWKAKLKNKYRIESGNVAYYKGKPTKKYSQYLENLLNNKDDIKKKPIKKTDNKESSNKKDNKEFSEQLIFNMLTGRNAVWNGSETKNYIGWKRRIHKKYNKNTGKNPYYRGKITQNYQKYLKNLIKSK